MSRPKKVSKPYLLSFKILLAQSIVLAAGIAVATGLVRYSQKAGLSFASTITWSPALAASVVVAGLVLLLTLIGLSLVSRRVERFLVNLDRQIEVEVVQRTQHGCATRDALILGLAKLADYRDTDTAGHLERVRDYSTLLAEALQGEFDEVTPEFMANLRVASCLHDVGKIGVPDEVLLEDGWLTGAERRVIERHPVIGADALIATRADVGEDSLIEMAIQIALYHHERWDGEGYPCGNLRDTTPLAARIVALADVYDALTSDRPYKESMTHGEAYHAILGGRAMHFDPAVVAAFEQVHERMLAVRSVHNGTSTWPVKRTPRERLFSSQA